MAYLFVPQNPPNTVSEVESKRHTGLRLIWSLRAH
jgi:hypothetical protein